MLLVEGGDQDFMGKTTIIGRYLLNFPTEGANQVHLTVTSTPLVT